MSRLSADERDRIAGLFDRHLEVGLHHGAQCAVYVDGDLVLDLAGGRTGPEGGETTPETRHVVFSCTKPYAAAALHALVEDGDVAYDDRVVDHWPTFAADGTAKATITVRQVLSHTSGLAAAPIDDRPERWGDWDAVVDSIEAADPIFEPGERPAYHELTFGWLVGELVRRVSGTSIEAVAAERVFEPLGMSRTGIGLRDDEPDDVATLVGFEPFDRCRTPGDGMDDDHVELAELANTEGFRRAVIPAANGVGTARDMARFYACLADGGELDGTRILERGTVETLSALAAETADDGTLAKPTRYGLGVRKGGAAADSYGSLSPRRVFGHAGLGSSIGWADPEENVGFAYVTNGVRTDHEHQARANAMADAVRLALD